MTAPCYLRGILAWEEGDNENAERLVRQALSRVPAPEAARAAYLNGLGQTLYIKDDLEAVAEAWRACLDIDSGNAPAAYNYGTLCLTAELEDGIEPKARAHGGWYNVRLVTVALEKNVPFHEGAAPFIPGTDIAKPAE